MPRPKKPQSERKKLTNMWLDQGLALSLFAHAKDQKRTFTNLVELILEAYLNEHQIPRISPKVSDQSTPTIPPILPSIPAPIPRNNEPIIQPSKVETPFNTKPEPKDEIFDPNITIIETPFGKR